MAFKTGFYRGRQNLPPCHLGCISDAASCRVKNILAGVESLELGKVKKFEPKAPIFHGEKDF